MFSLYHDIKARFTQKPNTYSFQREFPNSYFPDEADNARIRKYGYTIIRNALPPEETDFLLRAYEQLKEMDGFRLDQKFQNSGRYASAEIRSFVMNTIGEFSRRNLHKLFNSDVYDENTTGAFQIKPPSKVSELNPHQDAPVIDETRSNGLFIWIPLCDITEKNGPVLVLPGSHLWGNHQRSLNVPWVFENHTKTLWKNMQPVYLRKGDVLCWDTALIHASLPNVSDQLRLAVTTTLLPKHYTMVEYFRDKQTPAGKIEKYRVERSFWESGNIMQRPPVPPNEFLGYEAEAFPASISRSGMIHLLEQTQAFTS